MEQPVISIIGIGAGHHDDITVRSVKVLNRCSALVIATKEELPTGDARIDAALRHISTGSPPVIITVSMPRVKDRNPDLPYKEAIADVRKRQDSLMSAAIHDAINEGHTDIAVLSWGDPMLFNGMTSIITDSPHYADCKVEIYPAISSVQSLAALAHKPITSIGKRALITSGRDLPAELNPTLCHITVMLTTHQALEHPQLQDWHVAWGCNLGQEGETLVEGMVADVKAEIYSTAEKVKEETGWCFEIANLSCNDA